VFRTFLEEKHCQENLDFLEAVEEYQNEGYKDQSPLRIYQDFVKDGADFQVNLDGKTISAIEMKISGLENQDRQNSELLRFVFQDAVDVISQLVHFSFALSLSLACEFIGCVCRLSGTCSRGSWRVKDSPR